MEDKYRLLILENNPDDTGLLLETLGHGGLQYTVQRVNNRTDFDSALIDFEPDLVFSDFHTSFIDGFTALKIVRDQCPGIPFIFISETNNENKIIRSLELGARDCINKSNFSRFIPVVKRALQEKREFDERKELQFKTTRLNRIYKMLRSINILIVHSHNRNDLFQGACDIAVKDGEFRLAWIGTRNKENNVLVPQIWSGEENHYLEQIRITIEDDSDACDTHSIVLNLKKIMIFNKISNHGGSPWKMELIKRGYKSLIILPLTVEGEISGAMALYTSTADYFYEDEIILLSEFANDITYAIHNITQQEKLDYLASYDVLTGLPNRLLFHEHLNYILSGKKTSKTKNAILIFDIKQFRHINSAFGRQIGDLVLQEVAIRLQKLSPDSENLGHISNDYFAIILPHVHDPAEIGYLLENRMFPLLQNPIDVSNNEIQINFTCGISIFPTDGEDADTLYRNAETALKKAKITGDQYLYYQPEMTTQITETLLIENKLRKALKENQFILLYQPRIDSQNREITGLEALIRWNDPDNGLIPPGQFIPILESSGLIIDVGIWALDKAASDYRDWGKYIKSVPRIAVNVSALQLKQKDFVDQMRNAICKSGSIIPMDIEITESLIMTNIEQNIKKLQAIRMTGVGIAIDDFGTGYSSLSYIAKLPVNALKIDRSFISTMNSEPVNMTIVTTIIGLAHSLDLKVVAEGVETEEQSKLLSLLKCDEMQGYLFSKPLPAKEIIDLIRINRKL